MTDLRCAIQSLAVGDSPLGTAGHDDHYLLVELPLPWPKSIEDHPLLAGVDFAPIPDPENEPATVATAGTTRVLALLSDQPASVAPDGAPVHRVIAYRGGDGTTFSHFQRHEAFILREDLADVLSDVIAGELSDLEPFDDGMTDMLICTHGTRDRCCGTDGARLFLELTADDLDFVRVWRTSHTGGHRFAPIALTFPDGYTWGRIDAALVRGMLDQSIDPKELLEHNRGCMGFAQPAAQVADAVALAEIGWDWSASEREAHVGPVHGTDQLRVEIGGAAGQLEVTIDVGAPVPVPACGEPIEAAKKLTAPLFVAGVELHT